MANGVPLAECFPPQNVLRLAALVFFFHLHFSIHILLFGRNSQQTAHLQCSAFRFSSPLFGCVLYVAARDLRLVEVFVYQIMCMHIIYTLNIITIRIYLYMQHVYFMLWMCFYPVFFFPLTIEKAFQIPRKLLFIQSLLNIIKRLQSALLEADSRIFLRFGSVYRLSRYILLCLATWFLIKAKSKNKALLCVCVCVCVFFSYAYRKCSNNTG